MRMKKSFKIVFSIFAALYPVIIFTLLVVLKLPVRVLSLAMAGVGFALFLAATGRRGEDGDKVFSLKPIISSALVLAAAVACFFTNKSIFLKLYSVVISLVFLITFGSTLFFPPTIIFRFAILTDKTIKGAPYEKDVESYCRKVCIIWCVFFIINGAIAAYTAFFCSDRIWSLYNGGISYLLMGLLFAVEFIIRKIHDRKIKSKYEAGE
jgi:uncharacterized membrane protein